MRQPAPADRLQRIGDLIEEIARLRREGAEQHAAQIAERLEELRRLTPPATRPVARNPLQAASELADVTRFEVPASHRKRYGNAITLAKKAVVAGLTPVLARAFASQRVFNEEVLAVLGALLKAQAESKPSPLTPEQVAERFERLLGAERDGAQSRGRRTAQRLRSAAKNTIDRFITQQRAFDQLAVNLIVIAASKDLPPVEEANKLIATLASRVDPLHERPLPRALKPARPILAEILRRQIAFNREVMLVLSNLLNGRPPVVAPSASDYRAWIAEREPSEVSNAKTKLATLRDRPLFSIVLPAWETPIEVLEQCLASVRAQLYDRWELIIADDGSRERRVRTTVAKWAAKDARIRYVRLENNQGIAGATNAAINAATGEWIAFLDHDDALAPHALAEVALHLARHPDVDWLYTDEDRLSPDGRERHTPAFKPDFSPELLRSTNYICHFVVARRELVREVGGLRAGFEGSQDYDFVLRLSEHSTRVAHLPKVLYHWRSSPLSLSQDTRKLKAASAAGARALSEHLARLKIRGEVTELSTPCEYCVRYEVRGEPLVSIVVPFKDRPELLEQLTRTLFGKTRYQNFELLLVSNNSKDPATFALLDALAAKDPRVRRLEWNHPFHYPRINNFATKHARGELLLFLNNDIEIVDPRWLDELVSHAQRDEVGLVGPKLLFPDGSIQHAGVVVGICGSAAHPFWRYPDQRLRTAFGHADWNRNYLSVTSACAMIRRDLFEQLGGFDEHFQVCGSDIDLGLRVWAQGKQVVYTAGTWLHHHESASRRNVDIPEVDFWESVVAYRAYFEKGDPFYNPNLTLTSTDTQLRESPLTPLELAAQELLARAR